MARSERRTAATALLLGLCASCSLGTFDDSPCKVDADCVEAFGFGAVCGGDGLCSTPQPAERCTRTFPEDLFSRPDRYGNAVIAGMVMERAVEKKLARERSARLAALQIGDEGGLDGRTVGIVFCDISADASYDELSVRDAARETARYLATDLRLPVILGPSGSDDTLAVFDELRGTDTVVISPAATSAKLVAADTTTPSDDSPGLLWRTVPGDGLQAAAIVSDMADRSLTDVAVIYQEGAYGEGLADEFSELFSGNVSRHPFASDSQRSEEIQRVSTSSATEVLFVSSDNADVIAFLNAVATNDNYDGKTLFLTDAAASQDVVEASPSEVFSRIRGTRPAPLDTSNFVYGTFVTAYTSEYTGEDVTQFSFTAHSYDAAWLAFLGSARAVLSKDAGGPGVARGLRRLSSGSSYELTASNWPDMVADLRAGVAIDVSGASGDLDFDAATEELTAPIEVWVVRDDGGGFEVVPDS